VGISFGGMHGYAINPGRPPAEQNVLGCMHRAIIASR
jgi:hypothetical protein